MASVQDFKDQFDRGQFNFGETASGNQVRDKDIEAAFLEATPLFNAELYPNDDIRTVAYLYLVAHFAACDANAAEYGGLGGAGMQTSRSADGVSESVQVPQWILDDPTLSQLCTTWYGRKYVLMASQYVTGFVQVVRGNSLP